MSHLAKTYKWLIADSDDSDCVYSRLTMPNRT